MRTRASSEPAEDRAAHPMRRRFWPSRRSSAPSTSTSGSSSDGSRRMPGEGSASSGEARRIRCHEQGSEEAGVPLCRHDDLLRLHAGRGHGERPQRGVLPLRPGQCASGRTPRFVRQDESVRAGRLPGRGDRPQDLVEASVKYMLDTVTRMDPIIPAVRAFNRCPTRQKISECSAEQPTWRLPFSLAEVRVLYEIAHRQRPSATELCEELGIDPGYLSRILRGLEKRGLVSRSQSRKDGRQSLLGMRARGPENFRHPGRTPEPGSRRVAADPLARAAVATGRGHALH